MYRKEDYELAKKARLNAHTPFSNFKVGAVLRCKNGHVYTGVNIENQGIQSLCAERTAFAKAISEGEKDFECITVVGGPDKGNTNKKCMPCGYCRQFMSEFVDDNFKIYVGSENKIEEYTIDDVLPHRFKI